MELPSCAVSSIIIWWQALVYLEHRPGTSAYMYFMNKDIKFLKRQTQNKQYPIYGSEKNTKWNMHEVFPIPINFHPSSSSSSTKINIIYL